MREPVLEKCESDPTMRSIVVIEVFDDVDGVFGGPGVVRWAPNAEV